MHHSAPSRLTAISPPPSPQLQGGCVRAAAALGCSVEGVEAIAVKDILLTRIAELLEEHKRTTQQVSRGLPLSHTRMSDGE